MADKYYMVGTAGPFIYDDTEIIDNPGGPFHGKFFKSFQDDSGDMSSGGNRVLTTADLGIFTGTYSVVVGVTVGGGGPKGLIISSRSFVFIKGLLTNAGGVTTVNI